MPARIDSLSDGDFERLLAFRDGLRRFLRWSEEQAEAAGLTAPQHQLLLAVRGHSPAPSIREVADHLLLRHHTVVGMVDRAASDGFVVREDDPADNRVVRLRLTAKGRAKLDQLAQAHLEELSRLRPRFDSLWSRLPPAS